MRRLRAVPAWAWFLAGGALASVLLGSDHNWDLRNYHLYGPYAWLHGRTFADVAPAQLQSFFNPLPHLPAYALTWALRDHPRIFAAVLGLPAGLAAWFLWLMARDLSAVLPLRHPRLAAALATALGVTGAAFAAGIGLSSRDTALAAPVLGALLLLLRAAAGAPRPRAMLLAGLALGGAAGLKLTLVPTAAALGLAALLVLGLRAAVPVALGMALGFAAAWGPHAWLLWSETGNPTFPFFARAWGAPDFADSSFADTRFLPRSWLQWAFYPFWWLRGSFGLVSELPMRDGRMALGMLSGFALLMLLAWPSTRPGRATRPLLLLLAAFFLAYGGWAWMFGIHRYIPALEGMAALLALAAAALVLRPRPALGTLALGAALALALATTVRPNWGRGPHGARLAAFEAPPPVPAGALLALLGDEPQAWMIPFLPRPIVAVGLGNNLTAGTAETRLSRRTRVLLDGHGGPLWSVAPAGRPEALREALLARHGLAVTGPCVRIRSTLERRGSDFCPLRRLSAPPPGSPAG